MTMNRRKVKLTVLPGEKLDGSGRVCIHLFLKDEKGPFIEPHVLHPATDKDGNRIKGRVIAKPARGRIACDRNKKPDNKPNKNGVYNVLFRTDSPHAVTCPKCLKTPECIALLEPLQPFQSTT